MPIERTFEKGMSKEMERKTCPCGRMTWYPDYQTPTQKGFWLRYYDDSLEVRCFCPYCGANLHDGGESLKMVPEPDADELREAFASTAHEAWCGWMQYLFSKSGDGEDGAVVIPKWAVERWRRQMNTPYADLPEEEKQTDREEADKYLTQTMVAIHG